MESGRLGAYRGTRVLVTGALGFIGSNLVRRLLELEATVTGLDSSEERSGANPFNLDGAIERIQFIAGDQRNPETVDRAIRDQQVIFNLVGQVSHFDSMVDPLTDLEQNLRAHLSLLEACKARQKRPRIVFASTRQVYGRPEYLPVDERHPVRPTDVNGIHKAAAEQYHSLYHRVYGMPTTVLRLTNTYGPRMLVKNDRQTFLGWFVRQVTEAQTIRIFGDGHQLRDFTYVDDAVEAFLLAGLSDAVVGDTFNVGGTTPASLLDVVQLLVELAGRGSYTLVPFPDEKKAIDVGSVYADDSRLRRALGWEPRVTLREGLAETLDFYARNRAHYWS
jgi:UDP-glucose 4-epimerase